jgi:hypothetical protein
LNDPKVVFEESSADQGKDDQQKLIEKLYARIGELSVVNDFLKKVLVLSLSSRRSLNDRDHKVFSINAQCQILGLSISSYYYLHCTERADNLQILLWLD